MLNYGEREITRKSSSQYEVSDSSRLYNHSFYKDCFAYEEKRNQTQTTSFIAMSVYNVDCMVIPVCVCVERDAEPSSKTVTTRAPSGGFP